HREDGRPARELHLALAAGVRLAAAPARAARRRRGGRAPDARRHPTALGVHRDARHPSVVDSRRQQRQPTTRRERALCVEALLRADRAVRGDRGVSARLKIGGPEMAPNFTWGPRHAPQTPSARPAPGNPGRSSVLRAGGSPLHGPRPAEWNAVIPEQTPQRSERPSGAVALLLNALGG